MFYIRTKMNECADQFETSNDPPAPPRANPTLTMVCASPGEWGICTGNVKFNVGRSGSDYMPSFP